MKLIIAEKPDMGRAFASFLFKGKEQNKTKDYITCGDTTVSWAFGHILEQFQPQDYDEKYKSWDEYIFPNPWKLKIVPGAKAHFKVLADLIKNADEIINGGDPDREGQLLVDEILQYLNYNGPVKRVLANAKDDDSLKRAFDHLEDNRKYKKLYEAGLARARADWLIGMNVTRAYSTASRPAGYYQTFNIGRVKTPTLALIVQREHDIKNFKPIQYYVLKGLFTKDNITFPAMYKANEDIQTDSEGHILDKSKLLLLSTRLDGKPIQVDSVTTKDGKTEPPLPYSLDTLQIAANRTYGLSPQTTLDTLQELYEAKYTSYPRSDCNYIPTAQHEDVDKIFKAISGLNNSELTAAISKADKTISSKAFNDKKITAHHAVIPTGVTPKDLKPTQKQIYELIAKQYILQFYPPSEWQKTEFTITIDCNCFTGSGKVIIKPGYTAAFKQTDNKDKDDSNTPLPPLANGDVIPEGIFVVEDKETKPPKRFTEGSLIKAMANIYQFLPKDDPARDKLKEVKGIGTPATRSTIINELLSTKSGSRAITPFLTKEKKELVPTPWGEQFISIISPSLTTPKSTADMEVILSDIESGQATLDNYMLSITNLVNENIEYAQKASFPKPVCGGNNEELVHCPFCKDGVLQKKKAKTSNRYFYVCNNRDCVNPLSGKTQFYEAGAKGPIIEHCPECGSVLNYIKGKNGPFWACSNPECKRTYNDINKRPDLAPRKRNSKQK